MKRLTAQASLQPPVAKQILPAKDMMKFCEESINRIDFVYIPSEAIANIRNTLANRCTLAKIIPATRGYHQFQPSTDPTIKMKHISCDDFQLEFDFGWPLHDDHCWVKHMHVVTTINIPSLSSASGPQYHISPNDIEFIENLIQVLS